MSTKPFIHEGELVQVHFTRHDVDSAYISVQVYPLPSTAFALWEFGLEMDEAYGDIHHQLEDILTNGDDPDDDIICAEFSLKLEDSESVSAFADRINDVFIAIYDEIRFALHEYLAHDGRYSLATVDGLGRKFY